jgi:predicted metal-binding membrane protein
MKNIFDLTKREQRVVVVIVVALVVVAFAKHLSDKRTQPLPPTVSSAEAAAEARSTSTPASLPAIHAEEEKPEPDDSR